MLKKILKTLFREKYVLAAFAVTQCLLWGFAYAEKFAPFGDATLLSIDLHVQYYPMMWEKLSDFFSVWSWNGALGFQTIAQSAYYTNSIFLLMLLPFSGYARITALHAMIFLKVSLSAAALAYYLGKKFKKYDIFTGIFGVAYGLGAYTLAYLNQPMWLDIVLFCPLILAALDRLMSGGSPVPYTLLLALAIFSNFYISFALCIFLALWFIVNILTEKRKGFRDVAKTTLKFAISSLGAALLCAFMLFPLSCHMENWISTSLGFPEKGEWYHGFTALVDSFSALSPTSLEYGPANVFCGSAAIFLLVTFLFNTRVPLGRRIVLVLLAAFLFVSFEWSYLDFIWHGLHFPNQLPGRQSFLFILVLSLIGYETVSKHDGVRFPFLLLSLFASAFFFLFRISESKNAEGRLLSLSMIAALFAFLVIALLAKRLPNVLRLARVGVALVLLVDICVNAAVVLAQSTRVTYASNYVKNEETMLSLAKKYQTAEGEFYRSELTPNFTFDCGQLYGFKGITYYSSTMNGETYRLMDELGNRVYAKNVSTIYMPTPFQDMMFGVKYHYMNERALPYAKRLEKVNGITVYESPYALPVAYAMDTRIKNIQNNRSRTGLRLQERFIGLASDSKDRLMMETACLDRVISNGTVIDGYMYVRDTESPATYTMEFEVRQDGYAYVEFDFTVGTYEITMSDGYSMTGHCGADQQINIGYLTYGDLVTVKVTLNGYSYARCGVNAYIIDETALGRAHKKLSSETLRVEYVSDTEIRGTITVSEDRVLYASIPAEEGWEVYIDGEKRESYDLGMGLLFCDIEAGEHTVEYRYRAPGLALGIAVSSVTAAVVFIYAVLDAVRKKRRRENP
jgi:uncharacterized membrane protein YfhO